MKLERFSSLPGAEIVEQGLEDLAHDRETIEAILVTIASRRLRWLGIEVPPCSPDDQPEKRLYRLLSLEDPRSAHSHYNSWIRRLVSFESALEREVFRARRKSTASQTHSE